MLVFVRNRVDDCAGQIYSMLVYSQKDSMITRCLFKMDGYRYSVIYV